MSPALVGSMSAPMIAKGAIQRMTAARSMLVLSVVSRTMNVSRTIRTERPATSMIAGINVRQTMVGSKTRPPMSAQRISIASMVNALR